MNVLSREKRIQIVSALVEGVSIRATCRMFGVSKNTVAKLIVDLGRVCADYQDKAFHNLTCRRIQCDEIWSFVGCKQKNVPEDERGTFGRGDVWTWTAIDAETKLVMSWLVADRSAGAAWEFINDLSGRLAHRVQLTTDGHKAYLNAVEDAFGTDVDYAMLVKLYGGGGGIDDARRYSPAECTGAVKMPIKGDPDLAHVSTSYVERHNLTMRMQMRRFTRLTNAFSKKVENHEAAVALYTAHYNLCRVHQTLRVTPAMEAGLSDHVWELGELIDLLSN